MLKDFWAITYQGMPGVIAPSEVIEIEGQEYISGPTLISLIETRISFTSGKTKQYLTVAKNSYHEIVNLSQVRDIKEIFLEQIKNNRPHLKRERIQQFYIYKCEFTGTDFIDFSEVEFAHIDSVAINPQRALDITNGVIILKHLHSELTRMNINNFDGMYRYCQEKGYSTNWAT